MTTPKAPKGLREAGKALWAAVLDDYELAGHEVLLLVQACRVADRCDQLQALVDEAGPMLNVRTHPALVELRNQQITLARLVVALRVPLGDQEQDEGPGRLQRRGLRGMYGVKAS